MASRSAPRSAGPNPPARSRKRDLDTPATPPDDFPIGGTSLREAMRPTATEGVYLNASGCMVDERGILLTWARSAETEQAQAERILGQPIQTPVDVLKRVALDPAMPLALRLDAAAKAAPYTDMRMPLRVNTADVTPGASGIDVAKLSALPRKEREALLELLRKVGVQV